MGLLLLFLVVVTALFLAFWGGAIIGIADCKKRFSIPKKAVGVDDDGSYIY